MIMRFPDEHIEEQDAERRMFIASLESSLYTLLRQEVGQTAVSGTEEQEIIIDLVRGE